jgi:expansin (peptidoglycan-binding protein)
VIDTESAARRRLSTLLATIVALLAVVGTVVAVADTRSAFQNTATADFAAPAATPTPTAFPVDPVPTSGPAPSPVHATPPSESSRPRPAAEPDNTRAPVTTRDDRADGGIVYGRTYTGTGTFYAATGAGSCLFDASADLMVAAINQRDYANAQACGARLAVTGPNGRTIAVRVVDRCPECPAGALDLSQQAFTQLAPASAGKITISWTLLSPALRGPVQYVYKEGSSASWCSVQVRNHRNPVRTLDLEVDGTWKTLSRQEYNYFESPTGAGCGGAIRITDIYGHQLTETGIAIRPGVEQAGTAQFGPPA